MTLASGVSAGGVLTEEDTGTVLTLTRADGSQMVFWLKTDGSLHWKNPGDSTFIFEKIG